MTPGPDAPGRSRSQCKPRRLPHPTSEPARGRPFWGDGFSRGRTRWLPFLGAERSTQAWAQSLVQVHMDRSCRIRSGKGRGAPLWMPLHPPLSPDLTGPPIPPSPPRSVPAADAPGQWVSVEALKHMVALLAHWYCRPPSLCTVVNQEMQISRALGWRRAAAAPAPTAPPPPASQSAAQLQEVASTADAAVGTAWRTPKGCPPSLWSCTRLAGGGRGSSCWRLTSGHCPPHPPCLCSCHTSSVQAQQDWAASQAEAQRRAPFPVAKAARNPGRGGPPDPGERTSQTSSQRFHVPDLNFHLRAPWREENLHTQIRPASDSKRGNSGGWSGKAGAERNRPPRGPHWAGNQRGQWPPRQSTEMPPETCKQSCPCPSSPPARGLSRGCRCRGSVLCPF